LKFILDPFQFKDKQRNRTQKLQKREPNILFFLENFFKLVISLSSLRDRRRFILLNTRRAGFCGAKSENT